MKKILFVILALSMLFSAVSVFAEKSMKTWSRYVDTKWLEITFGAASYLVSFDMGIIPDSVKRDDLIWKAL